MSTTTDGDFTAIDWSKMVIPKLTPGKKQPGYRSGTPTIDGMTIRIVTPTVVSTFGVGVPKKEGIVIEKYSIPFWRDGGKKHWSIDKLFEKHAELDRFMVQYAFEHQDVFFPPPKKGIPGQEDEEPLTLKEVKRAYVPTWKFNTETAEKAEKSEKYGPSISPTIRHNKETGIIDPQVLAYGPNGAIIDLLSLVGRKISLIETYDIEQVYCLNMKNYGVILSAKRLDVRMFHTSVVSAPVVNRYGDEEDFEKALAVMPMPESSKKREREEDDGAGAEPGAEGAGTPQKKANTSDSSPAPAPAPEVNYESRPDPTPAAADAATQAAASKKGKKSGQK